MNLQLFDRSFAGSPLSAWAWTIGVVVVLAFALSIAKRVFLSRIAALVGRTRTRTDDLLIALVKRTGIVVLIWLVLAVALRFLTIPAGLRAWVSSLAVIAVLIQFGIWATAAVDLWVSSYSERHLTPDATSVMTIRVVGFAVRVLAWGFVLLLALDNVGVDVTALITGLGIGGVAVALAVQNVLGDGFAALAIVLDKPFVLGDFIIVGPEMGTVEQIGLKTTRIRSLSGEQVIFSNSDLTSSRIHNYKRMRERRVVFRFGVLYETRAETIEALAGVAKEAVLAQTNVRFDRSHFAGFGDSSLDFEVVYYVLSPDYSEYMNIQQAINLTLLRRVRELGTDFAFPTRTLYMTGLPALGSPAVAAGPRHHGAVEASASPARPPSTKSSD
jgi:small-conductance mechanosensitive channel